MYYLIFPNNSVIVLIPNRNIIFYIIAYLTDIHKNSDVIYRNASHNGYDISEYTE